MFDAHAHRHDMIRGAEEDRESAKGRKRETDGEEYQAPRGNTRHVRSQPTVALSSFAFSPFRAFAIPFPKASRDIQVKGIPAAETWYAGKLAHLRRPCPSRRRDPRRGRESRKRERAKTRNRRRTVSGPAWPHATRSQPANRRSPFFRLFALSRFRDPLSESIPRCSS